MFTLAIVGGATLVAMLGAGALYSFRRRRTRIDPIGRDVVYMEEEVLQEFLHAEFERNVAAQEAQRSAQATSDKTPPKLSEAASARAAQTRAEQQLKSNRTKSANNKPDMDSTEVSVGASGSERVIPSFAGGATAVAGPPTDLADEGWARDPQGRHEWRYFDSEGWSDFVLDGDNVDTDPLLTGAVS